MKNKSVTVNSKGFASWIEDFIIGITKNASKEEQEVKEGIVEEEKEEIIAEINLNDLDKVVWKEEVFGVHFDEKGASLINEFGNVIRTLPECKTIEEVDKQLNGNEIIVANNENEDGEDSLEEELSKIADTLDSDMTNTTPEHLEPPQPTDVQEQEETEFQNPETPIEASKDNDEKEEEDEEKEDSKNKESKEDGKENDDELIDVIASGFEELENTIEALNKRLALVEQQYARLPQIPEDNSANQIVEEEVKHFTETADETARNLANEQNVDITTPAGRVELSKQNNTSEIEEIVTQDTTPENTSNKGINTVVEENVEENNKSEEYIKVEKLSGTSEKIFQKGVCPETGEELIRSSKVVNNYLGVYSSAGTEYAVNLETGEIYKFLK